MYQWLHYWRKLPPLLLQPLATHSPPVRGVVLGASCGKIFNSREFQLHQIKMSWILLYNNVTPSPVLNYILTAYCCPLHMQKQLSWIQEWLLFKQRHGYCLTLCNAFFTVTWKGQGYYYYSYFSIFQSTFFLIVCMSVCECNAPGESRREWWIPGAGVTGHWELSNMGN